MPQPSLVVLGLKETQRAFLKLPNKVQFKIARSMVRRSAVRVQPHLLLALSGGIVNEDTGTLVNAIESQRAPVRRSIGGSVLAGFTLPTRAQLGIPRYPRDFHYYPTVLEYGGPGGHPVFAPWRKTADARAPSEIAKMAAEVATRVPQEFSALSGFGKARAALRF